MHKEKERYTFSQLQESHCLDRDLIPSTGRFMYESANLYTMSMDMEGNIVSETCFDNEEEGVYVKSILCKELLENLIEHMELHFLEDVVTIPMEDERHVCQGVIIRGDNQPYLIIAVLGVLETENGKEGIPDSIKTTAPISIDQNVEMIAKTVQSSVSIAIRLYESQRKLKLAKEKEEKLYGDYVRSALLADIVQMLESEEEIVDVIEVILEKVSRHLGVELASLYRINSDGKTLSIIGEWAKEESYKKRDDNKMELLSEYPFMKSENYVISSTTELREEQREYMKRQNITATIVLPVIMDKKVIMYLTFSMVSTNRVWEIDTVRFLSDTRKIVQSIISKRVTQNSLTSSMASLEDILENIGCGVMVVDSIERRLLFQNHLLDERVREKLSGINLSKLFDEDGDEAEYYIEDLNVWVMINQSRIIWVNDREVELYAVYDITNRKQIERKFEKSSNSDFLTGLFNRKRCEQDLQELLDEIGQGKEKGALLFVDLDDFKHINDGLGHQYGDILLKAISDNLRKIKGVERNCYRVGGDEFIVIVAMSQYDELDRIIHAIEEVFSHTWFLKGADYYCTMSMGACIFPDDASNVEDIMRKADLALYEAKKRGKNQVVFYSEKVLENDVRRLDLEKYMREACLHPEQEFEVYYQPIIDVEKEGNHCVGAEALVRWNSKELGRMSPADFIPLAEYLGLIKNIGDYVLREACKACKRWNDMGHPDYKVNVNFSVVQLLQNNMKEKIKEILDETGLEPHHLTLEVTESLAINDITYMKKLLEGIREYGVRVALDDFGTGYSSLNHIHELPIDVIKVDRCFVENVGKDEYSQVFVKMVSELAKAMGMNVCVEGVEEELQYRAVLEHGVKMIQGYYFAEPVPLREFEIKYVD